MNERLSALMDSELEAHEREAIFSALGKDNELRQRWDRYHLIAAAMRSDLQVMVHADLAARIAKCVEAEKSLQRKVVVFPGRRLAARYAGRLALAASVAVISIYGVRFVWPETARSVDMAANVSPGKQVAPKTTVAKSDPAQRKWEKDLNALLVQHSEYSPTSGMGVMPYVRITAQDDN